MNNCAGVCCGNTEQWKIVLESVVAAQSSELLCCGRAAQRSE